MKLDRENAIVLSIELWENLAKTGVAIKSGALESHTNEIKELSLDGELTGDCWLCEWARQTNTLCEDCPLAICSFPKHPFALWADAASENLRKYYAQQIVDKLRAALKPLPDYVEDQPKANQDKVNELIEKYGRVELGIDGNQGFALLGGDLQEGYAAFYPVQYEVNRATEPGVISSAEAFAAKMAFNKLKTELGRDNLSYYFGPSHPFGK